MDDKNLRTFISIIIIGYFGIKIIYGLFFGFYPQKYYNRNINITSNMNNDNEYNNDDNEYNNINENITLNAYVPGLWNNEMTDFITLIVVVFVIYIFTNASTKGIFNEYGNLNIAFVIGYVLGLGYPPIYNSLKSSDNTSSSINSYILFGLAFIIIVSSIVTNYNESTKLGGTYKINYIIYCVVIILLIGGLISTRKKSENYSVVSYFNSNGEQCTFIKNGVIQTSGDFLNITAPFMAFVIILLFTYEPQQIGLKNFYITIYGILLGIIVSGISYYGMEYFLFKVPQKECNSIQECVMKKMPIPVEENTINDEEYKPILIDSNINGGISSANIFGNKISGLNVFLVIVIIMLIVYLIYYYISS